MKAIQKILITASLMLAGTAIVAAQDTAAPPAPDKAAALARVRVLEQQIRALETELDALKASLATAQPAAITVSIDPKLKSAEPLPEIVAPRRGAPKKGPNKNFAKAYR